jgi:hypothetical protein
VSFPPSGLSPSTPWMRSVVSSALSSSRELAVRIFRRGSDACPSAILRRSMQLLVRRYRRSGIWAKTTCPVTYQAFERELFQEHLGQPVLNAVSLTRLACCKVFFLFRRGSLWAHLDCLKVHIGGVFPRYVRVLPAYRDERVELADAAIRSIRRWSERRSAVC